ncbi:hypothetical protein [Kineosporia babensis]|uniref:Secreted protein n=1 Tax=Kineosporia babensis TaxID=499548 RepID=A0A9X1NF12_9ACTN|nr:hypothetical protein [Kineosporia babensis]MCD5312586.1 hypothetical protein [Kineosporia babensis]
MTTAIVIIVLVALLLIGLFAFQKARRNAELQQRRAELKDRFGPEYERYLEGSDNRGKAERKLAALVDRREKLQIRELTNEEKARFGTRWSAAQARFVDEPPSAVDDAETLITQVMKERGYPMDDFATRSDMVMVDHPAVVQHYRSAHESHERHRASGKLDTEDLRVAFMHYRKLFHVLTDSPEPVSSTRPMPAGKHVEPAPSAGEGGRRETQPLPKDAVGPSGARVPDARGTNEERVDAPVAQGGRDGKPEAVEPVTKPADPRHPQETR